MAALLWVRSFPTVKRSTPDDANIEAKVCRKP
jgi:hypothetical protein